MTRRPGLEGWDVLNALIPEAEMGDLIVELRSATAGVGNFVAGSTIWPKSSASRPDAIIAQHQCAKALAH